MQQTLNMVIEDVNQLKTRQQSLRRHRSSDSSSSSSSSSASSRDRSKDKGARRSQRSRKTRRRTRPRRTDSKSPVPKRRRKQTSSSRSVTPVRTKPRNWGDHMDLDNKELPDYSQVITFSDSDDDDDGGEQSVMEVSSKTSDFLTKRCTHSLTHEARRKTRRRFPLPKVTVTKTVQNPDIYSGRLGATNSCHERVK